MKWKTLQIGPFIDAKRIAVRAYNTVMEIYAGEIPEGKEEETLAKAESEWQEFLSLALDPESTATAPHIAEMTPEEIRGAVTDFMLRQVGRDRKPNG